MIISAALVSLLACGEEPRVTEGGDRTPYITGGSIDSGHPSVGKLRAGGSACTATLVGDRTVLTAGHCVPRYPVTFTVEGMTFPASRVIRHESYGGGNRNDVAVVLLSATPPVTPTPLNVDPVRVGQPLTIVGYGNTAEGSNNYGTKRVTYNTISRVSGTTFSFSGTGNVCNGDSGGPSFVVVDGEERIAGVHSTKSGACGWGGNDMRVDAYRQWISGAADGDLLLPGDSPSSPPGDCHGSTPSFDWSYCSESCRCGEGQGDCDSDSECADGLVCEPDIGASYGQSASLDVCVKPAPTGVREGESCAATGCAANLTCVSVYGSQGSSLGRFCMERCSSPGGSDPICETGETCTRARTGATVCFNPGASSQGYTTP